MRAKAIWGLLMLFGSAAPLFSYSDQTTSERILGENREFIEFMNICVTNFGKDRIDELGDKFLKIYQFHFNGQVCYLQSDYKNAFRNVRLSQEKNVLLSSEVIRKVYLEDAKVLLDKLAPEIIKSKNARARLYLTLGYRDRAVGRNYEVVSDASNPKLYSYKIFRYLEGIKMARRAKRYGLLALYESRDDATKRMIFNNILEEDNKSGNMFYRRFAGKADKEIHEEINNSYEKIVEWESAQPKLRPEKGGGGGGSGEEESESKVDRRVRYRKEKMTAKSIMYAEFDKAESVMREYIKDFNFKLIFSTIKVMAQMRASGTVEGPDYSGYLLHHFDNYSRIFDHQNSPTTGEEGKKTLLEELTPQVRVIGDIPREGAEGKAEDGAKGADGSAKAKGEGDTSAK